jgi:hypothetical protein
MIITLLLKLRSESDICSKHIPDLGVDVNLQLISLTVFLTPAQNQPLPLYGPPTDAAPRTAAKMFTFRSCLALISRRALQFKFFYHYK